jgi:ribosomal protein L32
LYFYRKIPEAGYFTSKRGSLLAHTFGGKKVQEQGASICSKSGEDHMLHSIMMEKQEEEQTRENVNGGTRLA